jgi:hypothetical protein
LFHKLCDNGVVHVVIRLHDVDRGRGWTGCTEYAHRSQYLHGSAVEKLPGRGFLAGLTLAPDQGLGVCCTNGVSARLANLIDCRQKAATVTLTRPAPFLPSVQFLSLSELHYISISQ